MSTDVHTNLLCCFEFQCCQCLGVLQDWEDAVNQRKKETKEVNPKNDSTNKKGDIGKKKGKGEGGKEDKYL